MEYSKGSTYLEGQLRRKRRRNSSASKKCTDVSLSTEINKKVLAVLTTNKDTDIVFSDEVQRVGNGFKLEPYQLVISSKRIYLFRGKDTKLKESLLFNTIESVCLSHQSDNFCIIKLKGRTDIIFISYQKCQVVAVLARLWETSSTFPLSVNDRVRFTHVDNIKYTLVFTRTSFGVQTSIYHDKDSAPQEPSTSKKAH